jgi:hypothetical protein
MPVGAPLNWIRHLWRGEVRLVAAFWLYGVVGIPTVIVTVGMLYGPVARLGPVVLIGFLAAGTAILLAYQALVLVGISRSAGRYAGWPPWVWLARMAVGAGFLLLCVTLWTSVLMPLRFYYSSHNSMNIDSFRNSMNAASTLRRDPAYPLTGFWKTSCDDAFGLLVEPASTSGKYSVSFCGPGGCFTPGTYRPDTPISGDPAYRILDEDHLEVRGLHGFSKYARCE